MSMGRWFKRHRWLIKERPTVDAAGAGATLREEYGAENVQQHHEGDYYVVAGQAVQGSLGVGAPQPQADVPANVELDDAG